MNTPGLLSVLCMGKGDFLIIRVILIVCEVVCTGTLKKKLIYIIYIYIYVYKVTLLFKARDSLMISQPRILNAGVCVQLS